MPIHWGVYPAPFTSALHSLLEAPKMCCLTLSSRIIHFPLASALSLTHLVIPGVDHDMTMPQISPEEPAYLQTLRVGSYVTLCRILDLPQFFSLSRLVHLDAAVYVDAAPVIIQHIVDGCASTLQDLHLRCSSNSPSVHQLSLALLTSLTNLSFTLMTSTSLHLCTQTLSTLPSYTSPWLTLAFHADGILRYDKYSWNKIDYVHLWAKIDLLPIRALHIYREDHPHEGCQGHTSSVDDEPKLKELFPKLAMRKALVGPPPLSTATRSPWKRMLRG
ncbi:hypothetical protein DXG01_002050 [Tephrocybe rancida]|nr:hypothetical protein DXG01_002050 [Tephrocybe rancida]